MTDQEKIELLATRVMGWEKREDSSGKVAFYYAHGWKYEWNPLHNIADAWMIVYQLLESERFKVEITVSTDGVVCDLINSRSLKTCFCADGDTAQEAICNAALKAVGVDVG